MIIILRSNCLLCRLHLQEEEERIKREQEEAERKAAEEERIRLEQERIDREKRELKKQREREKKERLKAEGKFLTPQQRAKQIRAQKSLEALRAQGITDELLNIVLIGRLSTTNISRSMDCNRNRSTC